MQSEADIHRAMEQYADMIQRICLCHMKNREDTEDVFQNVFLKYLLYDGVFQDEEHEKAWFIRVTLNACRDRLRDRLRHNTVSLERLPEEAACGMEPEYREVLEAVLSLPAKYRDAIYLHYYEGYTAAGIAAVMKRKEGTIYSLLSRGRAMLREKLGGDGSDESNP